MGTKRSDDQHLSGGSEASSNDVDFKSSVGADADKLSETVRRARVPTAPAAPRINPTSGIDGQIVDAISVDNGDHQSLLTPSPPLSRKRGKTVMPSHSLDLHGETVADSVWLLKQFFDRAVLCSHHSVLIIHGKGLHSEGGAVLRNVTLNWLRIHATRYRFKEMYHPKRKLGGNGATVVVFR